MGPYGSQNFKTLHLPQITIESYQTLPEFSSQLFSIIWKTSDRREKRIEIWVSGLSIQCTQGTFDN